MTVVMERMCNSVTLTVHDRDSGIRLADAASCLINRCRVSKYFSPIHHNRHRKISNLPNDEFEKNEFVLTPESDRHYRQYGLPDNFPHYSHKLS